ncbi:MAG: STAS domain-containing protein, partial [Chitinispirillaceae bacterium]|nr:STAS domain-containing protein [Chitinispirillaceae bacterium]
SDSQECKDFVKEAFEISEKYDSPIIVRLSTRIAHSQSVVEVGEKEFFREPNDVMLDISKEIVNDVCIFNMSGTMSHPVGSIYFKQTFLLVLADYKKILLDMEELSFIDSMSLSTILSLNRLLTNTGGSMRICRTNSIIKEIFNLLRIETIIPMFSTRQEALAKWE